VWPWIVTTLRWVCKATFKCVASSRAGPRLHLVLEALGALAGQTLANLLSPLPALGILPRDGQNPRDLLVQP
jgi:hypothetical protein